MALLFGFMAITVMTLTHQVTADLNSTIATYSPACQLIVNHNASEFSNKTEACSAYSILVGYESRVRIGFCNEEEYNNLTNTVCETNYTRYPSSAARVNFNAELNNVSTACQRRVYECIYASVIAIVSKQQEQYCSLVNLDINNVTSESCLTTGESNCTQVEFQRLRTTACRVNTTTTNQVFSTVLLRTSMTCQSQISRCADNSSEAWWYMWSEDYCAAMYIGGDKPTEACLRGNDACTLPELSALKFAACGTYQASADLNSTIATYSPACQLVVNYNASEFINKTVACSAYSILVGYESRVRIGFCNEEEYNNLTNTVCETNYTRYPSSAARVNFNAELNNVSTDCQRRVYECIYTSVIAIVSKQQERYCSLVNLEINNVTSENCLTTGESNCTQDEFQSLSTAACRVNTTTTNQVFSTALLSTTMTCQSQISQCAGNSSEAWGYVWSEDYCTAMYIGGDKTTEACFRENNACTAAEFSALKFAACGPESATTTQSTTALPTTNATSSTKTNATTLLISSPTASPTSLPISSPTASPSANTTVPPLANMSVTTPTDFALNATTAAVTTINAPTKPANLALNVSSNIIVMLISSIILFFV